jgi:hypothetical protein
MALGGRILERGPAFVLEDRPRDLQQLLAGEELRGGEAARERDDLRLLGDLQELADVRGLHPAHPVREPYRHEPV